MIGRYRRSSGIERQQLKWLTAAVAIVTFLYSAAVLVSLASNWGTTDTPTWLLVLQNVAITSFLLIPITIGLSVVRYHLYDIDLVINKALIVSVIVVFITLVYLGILVGVGALIGKGDESNTVLAVVATAIVAIAFQPLRKRATELANRLVFGKAQSREEVLAAYLPQGVADRLASGTAGHGQQEEVVATVLFSDLRGFTSLAEWLSPRALVDLIGIHLGAMAEVVQAHGGMVDKFQGDAVMAVFGVAAPQPDHATAAVHCALGMQDRQAELNRELDSRAEQLLEMGVGLNTGIVIAGTIGGGGRLEYTVVGDAVNIASRLQSEAAGGEILAGADTI
ncbi:MAG: adenylate/guanylate cyclase domain-containing protein, partial [Actinomycetota bacterium]